MKCGRETFLIWQSNTDFRTTLLSRLTFQSLLSISACILQRFDWQTIMLINIHNVYVLHHSDDMHSDLHILCIWSSCKVIYDGRAPSIWRIMWLLSAIIHREGEEVQRAACTCVCIQPTLQNELSAWCISCKPRTRQIPSIPLASAFLRPPSEGLLFEATSRPPFGYRISWEQRIIFFWGLILGDRVRY